MHGWGAAMMLVSMAGTGWLRGPVFAELFPLALTPVLLAGMWYRNALPRVMRRGYAVLLGVVIVAFGALCMARARSNVADPPRWDVQAFWLFGKVAVVGDDFYRPESFHAVADSLRAAGEPVSTAGDFNRELLDVGFPYPPMTMLLFAPLGLLGLHAAALLWYLVIIASTVAVIGVLWHRLFEPHGRWELAFTTAMVLTLRATYSTYAFGQAGCRVLSRLDCAGPPLALRDGDCARARRPCRSDGTGDRIGGVHFIHHE